MAAITALKVQVVDDEPGATAREVRKQWNAFVEAIAAVDGATATTAQIVTALQLAKKVVTSLELAALPRSSY